MKDPVKPSFRSRERGVAAVEMAIIMPVLLSMLITPFFLAVYFWHYSAVYKTAYSGARFLSTVSVREMNSPELSAAMQAQIQGIINDGLSDLHPAARPLVDIDCDGMTCGDGPPQEVLVRVRLRVFDNYFRNFYTGDRGLLIQAAVRLRYVGN